MKAVPTANCASPRIFGPEPYHMMCNNYPLIDNRPPFKTDMEFTS